MRNNLRDSTEFQHVYTQGKRFEGSLITVFIVDNQVSHHRFGVTASKKALGKAVQRNRAKRLLREAFRNSEEALRGLQKNYDWVLNAKRKIVSEKLSGPAEEFKHIVEQVRDFEATALLK